MHKESLRETHCKVWKWLKRCYESVLMWVHRLAWRCYPSITYHLRPTVTLFSWFHKTIPTLRRIQQLKHQFSWFNTFLLTKSEETSALTEQIQTATIQTSQTSNIQRQTPPSHGAHLIRLVEKAAPTPLQQELCVLVNAAARKLSGQIKSVITSTHTHILKDQNIK